MASDREEAESIRREVEETAAAAKAAVQRRRRFERRKRADGINTGTLSRWLGVSRKTILKDLAMTTDDE